MDKKTKTELVDELMENVRCKDSAVRRHLERIKLRQLEVLVEITAKGGEL